MCAANRAVVAQRRCNIHWRRSGAQRRPRAQAVLRGCREARAAARLARDKDGTNHIPSTAAWCRLRADLALLRVAGRLCRTWRLTELSVDSLPPRRLSSFSAHVSL